MIDEQCTFGLRGLPTWRLSSGARVEILDYWFVAAAEPSNRSQPQRSPSPPWSKFESLTTANPPARGSGRSTEGCRDELERVVASDGDSGADGGKRPVTFLGSAAQAGIDPRLSTMRLGDFAKPAFLANSAKGISPPPHIRYPRPLPKVSKSIVFSAIEGRLGGQVYCFQAVRIWWSAKLRPQESLSAFRIERAGNQTAKR